MVQKQLPFSVGVAGVEWRGLRATSPQPGHVWGLATRPSWLDPSHPNGKVILQPSLCSLAIGGY